MGGGADSFFCVQPTDYPEEKIRVIGQPSDQIGIHIRINAAQFNDEIAAQVEKAALRGVNTIPGVRAYEKEEALVLEMAEAVGLDTTLIGEAIYAEIRSEFPRLKNISTTIIFDPQYLHAQAESLRAYKASRRQAIASMTEANTDQFCACIECRPFSLVHTCILTPERPPMCGARSYASAKSAAFFGSDAVPYKRPSEKGLPMRKVFSKGELLDPDRGEYSGVNLVYQELTGGQLRRVYLHSVRDYPLTSCGCFQALAFWLPEVAGIGIMSRNSPAVSPDGFTWDELANRAGGKQSPGIVGVSYLYMHSPSFLKGDGGISNVVWVDKILHGKIHKLFSPGQRVAIEEDVKSIEDLATFLKR
jgi:acetyl-CoA decarbonylase/synthase complex subunit beta